MSLYDETAACLAELFTVPTSALRRMEHPVWDMRAYGGKISGACNKIHMIAETWSEENDQVFIRLGKRCLEDAAVRTADLPDSGFIPSGLSREAAMIRRLRSHLESGMCPELDLEQEPQRTMAREILYFTRFGETERLLAAAVRLCAADRAPEILARAVIALLLPAAEADPENSEA